MDDLLEGVPHLVLDVPLPFQHPTGRFHVGGNALFLHLLEEEGLEELQGHALGQAALVELELGTHHDHAPPRVVHPLAQEVLAEAALLAGEDVGEAPKRPFGARVGDGGAAAAVVDDRIHRLLQHALLVADDDLRGPLGQELLQAVVAVDEAAVEVVEVAGGEAPPVHLDHGTEVRGKHGHRLEDHPLRAVAGVQEGPDHLEALPGLGPPGPGGVLHLLQELGLQLLQVQLLQEGLDGLGPHAGVDVVGLHHPHHVPDQVHLHPAVDLALDLPPIRQDIPRGHPVPGGHLHIVLKGVEAGLHHHDAGGLVQVDDALGLGDHLLLGVNGRHHLLPRLDVGSFRHHHVHVGSHPIVLGLRPLQEEGEVDGIPFLLRLHLLSGHVAGHAQKTPPLGQGLALFHHLPVDHQGGQPHGQEVAGHGLLVLEEGEEVALLELLKLHHPLLLRPEEVGLGEFRQDLSRPIALPLHPGGEGQAEARPLPAQVVDPHSPGEAVKGYPIHAAHHPGSQLLPLHHLLPVLDQGIHPLGQGVSFLLAVAELPVLLVREELALLHRHPIQHRPLGVQDDVLAEVQDLLQLGGGEVQEGADLGGHILHEPDVGRRGGQLDVPHAVAAHDALGDLHPAALAHLALKALALVLAAGALVVLGGAEDALVEKPIPLGLQGAVVDGFGLLHLPVAPGADLFRRGQGDANLANFLFHSSST